jgi:hypothetical protein
MTPTNFEKFSRALLFVTRNNNNLRIHTNKYGAELKYGNNTYMRYVPQNGKIWAWKGQTAPNKYQQGIGKRLRKYGVNAAYLAGVPLYHEGINLRNQVPLMSMPISTRIMRSLGAVPTGPRGLRFRKKKYSFLSVVPAHSKGTRSMTRRRRSVLNFNQTRSNVNR